mgnify:CR=1 FL=1
MTKRWCICFLLSFLLLLTGTGGLTAVIDPYFHYHKPLESFSYNIYNERYQNDGIVKHFDYDALITGTSMTENFKSSEMDVLFGVQSVKVPFSGAAYKEIRENLERAFAANKNIRIVLWGLDYNRFCGDFNAISYDSYPAYLYDYNPFNDVKYLFNKSVLFGETYGNVIAYTKAGGHTTTFDNYCNWNSSQTFGREAVLSQASRPAKTEDEAYRKLDPENIEENVLSVVKANPDTEFYLFWTPYSILFFDIANQNGSLKNILLWEKEALELMLPYENIHFFSLFDDYDVITNLDNYKDYLHYHEDINSYLLKCMASGEHELTLDNYVEYCREVWNFYVMYNYDGIYE